MIEGSMKYVACMMLIKWDVDEEEDLERLPKSVTKFFDFKAEGLESETEIPDFLDNWLSDTYGYCHKGYMLTLRYAG